MTKWHLHYKTPHYLINDFIVLPRSFIEDYQKLLNAQVNVNFNSQRTVKPKSLNKKYLMLL